MSTRTTNSRGRDITERITKALHLRETEGLSWTAIAERLGPGTRTAALKVQAERRKVKEAT